MKKQGFLLVCYADLERFDLALNPADIAELKLAFTPVELKATPFERLQYLGAHVDAMNDIRSTLYREFQLQKGVRASLKEHDMSADGTAEMEGPGQAPHLVNGQPSRYVKLRNTEGKEVDVLAWTEGRRAYQLSIKANAAGESSAGKIFDLARSLPRSDPACPDSATPATV